MSGMEQAMNSPWARTVCELPPQRRYSAQLAIGAWGGAKTFSLGDTIAAGGAGAAIGVGREGGKAQRLAGIGLCQLIEAFAIGGEIPGIMPEAEAHGRQQHHDDAHDLEEPEQIERAHPLCCPRDVMPDARFGHECPPTLPAAHKPGAYASRPPLLAQPERKLDKFITNPV